MRIVVARARHIVACVLYLVEIVDLSLWLNLLARQLFQFSIYFLLGLAEIVLARSRQLLLLGVFNYHVQVRLLLRNGPEALRLLGPCILLWILTGTREVFRYLYGILEV